MDQNVNPEQMKSWTEWFEIPVSDMERAKAFYETIFETAIQVNDFGELLMGIFPHRKIGCALCKHESYIPSDNGVLVYLNANPDLSNVESRIEAAGGVLIRPKTLISKEHGHMALFRDTEGNRLALHSDN